MIYLAAGYVDLGNEYTGYIEALYELVNKLEEENKRLREALEFYAGGNHYSDKLYDDKIILLDNGETARQALEGEQ